MTYFSKFPKIDYQIGNTRYIATDLMLRYKFIEAVLKNPLSYYLYRWKDGDRPDIVALNYYGSTDFDWVVMLSAEAFHWLGDFPVPEKEFDSWVMQKYNTTDLNSLKSTIKEYRDIDGDVIDQATYNSYPPEERTAVYIYDYEEELNENKRMVRLVSVDYLQQIITEFDKLIGDIK